MSFCLSFISFCFPDGIGKVVTTLWCLNEVYPASPYLDTIRSSVNKGFVIVSVK